MSAPDWLAEPSHPWSKLLDKVCHSSVLSYTFLSLLSAVLFFYGLSAGEFFRTEGLRALIAQEMLESGNWIVPKLFGEALFTKPPGMYVAIVLCSLPFGQVTEWSARLPSAIAATVCVFLFYWYLRRQIGRVAAMAAGILLPMSLMWLDKATSAEIDTLQVMWVLASILFFLRATEDETNPSFGWTLAALLCMAGGVLTKWTAVEFFYLTVIPFLWYRGQLRWLLGWQHLVSLAVAGGLFLAWLAAAVWLEGWPTFWNTFEREAFSRLVPTYSEKKYPWFESMYHPLKLLVVTLPWSALALLTLQKGFFRLWDDRGQRLLVALHSWTWPHMLFWSLPNEHTPRHSYPLFPGIAGLAALAWHAWYTGRVKLPFPRLKPVPVLACMLGLWLAAKVVFVERITPARAAQRQPRAKGAMLASLVPVDHTLFVLKAKDEATMFYFGRPVQLRRDEAGLPSGGYVLVAENEWREWWTDDRLTELVGRTTDELGVPMVLLRVQPR